MHEYRSGFILEKFFYEQLSVFRQSTLSLAAFYPKMLSQIDSREELTNWQTTLNKCIGNRNNRTCVRVSCGSSPTWRIRPFRKLFFLRKCLIRRGHANCLKAENGCSEDLPYSQA
jgi:hypothetical protein